jgi:GR25 family glycosyltransferase involved in LPS biosynthesis
MNIQVEKLPVLLTLHVRSEYLEEQLDTLKMAGIQELYISIDGPRNHEEELLQSKIFKLLDSIRDEFHKIEINKSDKNQGIAVAMISAIDWFFASNDYGAIFEDDVKFERETLLFFTKALESIKDMPNVLLVSGVQPFATNSASQKVQFTNYPQIWGWATYAKKWKEMRGYVFQIPSGKQRLTRRVKNFWRVGWKRVALGYLDTWDLPIAMGMLFSNKLCMLPPVNLTSNIGIDNFSTNTHSAKFPLGLKISKMPHEMELDAIPSRTQIENMNRKFEREIYEVKFRHIFSSILSWLDCIRFGAERKRPLKERFLLP